MSFEVRPASASDVDGLVAIERAVFEADRISRRSYRNLIGAKSAIVLVVDGGDAIAGCCVILLRAGSRRARLYSIAAAPGRSGVGRPLLDAAEEAARARGANAIRLEVREDNARAIGLYRKAGYREFGRKPDYYADGAAALRFEKPLAAEGRPVPMTRPGHGTAPS